MELTNKQVQGVCNMFANAFVHAESEEERKKILIDFEDTFSVGIVNWKTICGTLIIGLTTDSRFRNINIFVKRYRHCLKYLIM